MFYRFELTNFDRTILFSDGTVYITTQRLEFYMEIFVSFLLIALTRINLMVARR